MRNRRASGHMDVGSSTDVIEVDGSIVVDFSGHDVEIDLNGRRFAAETPTGLAMALEADLRQQATRLITISYDVTVQDERVIITSGTSTAGRRRSAQWTGCAVGGRQSR